MTIPYIIPDPMVHTATTKAIGESLFGEKLIRDRKEFSRIVRDANVLIPTPSLPCSPKGDSKGCRPFNGKGTEEVVLSGEPDALFHGTALSPDAHDDLPDTAETVAIFVNQRGLYNPHKNGKYRLPPRLQTALRKLYERTNAAMKATGRFYRGIHLEMSERQLENSAKRKKTALALLQKMDTTKLASALAKYESEVPFYVRKKINELIFNVDALCDRNLSDLMGFPSHAVLSARFAEAEAHNARLDDAYDAEYRRVFESLDCDKGRLEGERLKKEHQWRRGRFLVRRAFARHNRMLQEWCVKNGYIVNLSWAKFVSRLRDKDGQVNVWNKHLFNSCTTFEDYLDRVLHIKDYDGKMNRRNFQRFLPIIRGQTAQAIDRLMQDYPDMDIYKSEVTFLPSESRRTEDCIARIPNLFLDLDLKETPFYNPKADEKQRKELADTALRLVIHRCESKGIPLPSSVVWSGNGLHLRWNLKDPIARNANGFWKPLSYIGKDGKVYAMSGMTAFREMQNTLCGFFRDLGSDSNALDPVRVLRPLHTRNTKNGCPVTLLWPARKTGNGLLSYATYDAHALSRFLIGCRVDTHNDAAVWGFTANFIKSGHISPRKLAAKAVETAKTPPKAKKAVAKQETAQDENSIMARAAESAYDAEILAENGPEAFGIAANDDGPRDKVIPQVFETYTGHDRVMDPAEETEACAYPEEDFEPGLTQQEKTFLFAHYLSYRESYTGIPSLRKKNSFNDYTDYMERFRSLIKCLAYMARTENCTIDGQTGVIGSGNRNFFALHAFILYVNARRDSETWRKKGVEKFMFDCLEDVTKALSQAGIGDSWLYKSMGIQNALNVCVDDYYKNRGVWSNVFLQLQTYWDKGFIADFAGGKDYTAVLQREGDYRERLMASPGKLLADKSGNIKLLKRGRFPMLGYTVTVERIMDECQITDRIAFKAGATTLFSDEIRQECYKVWQSSDKFKAQMGAQAILNELGATAKNRPVSDEWEMNASGVLKHNKKVLRQIRKKTTIKNEMVRMMRSGRASIFRDLALLVGRSYSRVRRVYGEYVATGKCAPEYEYGFRQIAKLDSYIRLAEVGVNPFLNIDKVERDSSILNHTPISYADLKTRIFLVGSELRHRAVDRIRDRRRDKPLTDHGPPFELDERLPQAA